MRTTTRRAVLGVICNSSFAPCRQGHIYMTLRYRSRATNKRKATKKTYDDAIDLLNTLQTPYAELKRQWDAGIIRGAEDLQHTKDCFQRLGYTQDDLANLNIIHVAGTKGKGTVCTYVDSILNQFRKLGTADERCLIPKKVGLYTSPHLISVRERIRINSSPISEALFTKYFFEVWDKICVADEQGNPPPSPLPVYFRFLTLMSFHVFISESVDVAVYEVGMGGEYDATNIVERPAVTGITALGIDHTFHLGNTIGQIAWHKAGIFKAGVPAYTVEQPAEAMAVIRKRARDAGTDGRIVVREDPRLEVEGVKIQPDRPFQRQNASLAIALALRKVDPEDLMYSDSQLPMEVIDGLEGVVSSGRCEVKVTKHATWYLDGAHTADSIIIASNWFCEEVRDKPEPRVLIFNQQGHRESMELMEGLFFATADELPFDHVIFCPSIPPASSTRKDHVNLQTDLEAVALMTVQQKFADRWRELSAKKWENPTYHAVISVLPSLEAAMEYVDDLEVVTGGDNPRVFITGSIHLVGRALSILGDLDVLEDTGSLGK